MAVVRNSTNIQVVTIRRGRMDEAYVRVIDIVNLLRKNDLDEMADEFERVEREALGPNR